MSLLLDSSSQRQLMTLFIKLTVTYVITKVNDTLIGELLIHVVCYQIDECKNNDKWMEQGILQFILSLDKLFHELILILIFILTTCDNTI